MTEEPHRTEDAEQPPEAGSGDAAAQDLSRWLKDYGPSTLLAVVVGLAVYFGMAWMRHRKAGAAADAAALLERAGTPEQLQAVVDRYPKTPSGPVAQLALGAQRFAAGEYAAAREAFDAFITRYPRHPSAVAASLNRLQCLEAEGRPEEALAGYRAFAADHPDHYLRPLAWLGQGRCQELGGRLEEARATYEDFIAEHAGSEWTAQAQAALEFVNQQLRAARAPAAPPAASPPVEPPPAAGPDAPPTAGPAD